MECAVCFEAYDLEAHRPKNLPCGHSLCLRCLREPGLGRRCPQDRQEFQDEPARLPDNLSLISIIAHGGTPQRPAIWCRDCRKELSEDCVEAGHASCTLRQLRAERVASHAKVVERGAAASTVLERLYAAVNQDAQRQMQACRADRRQLQETLAKLEATAKARTGLKQAMDEAEQLGPRAEQLEEAASLAGLRGRCSVVVQAEDGAEWQASVAMEDGKRRALRHALLELRSDGDLSQVREEELPSVSNEERRALDLSEKDLSIMTAEEVADFLQDDGLKKVRSLRGVDCGRSPRFCALLLRTVAPLVEELQLRTPQAAHVAALREMPFLRKLSLAGSEDEDVPAVPALPASLEELSLVGAKLDHLRLIAELTSLRKLRLHCEAYYDSGPGLPLQLEDLTVENCSRPQLLSMQRMPRLRRLFVDGSPNDAAACVLAAVPAGHCGLSQLRLACRDEAFALALLRAHAATLQEVRVFCGSVDDDRKDRGSSSNSKYSLHFGGLADCLRQCRPRALRRLALVRRSRGWPDPPHSAKSCRRQVRDLQSALQLPGLPRADAAGRAKAKTAAVSVVCELCDEGDQ